MDISMNIQKILESNITISEYFYLRNLYVKEDDKIPELFKLIDTINEDSLQDRGFIKITEDEIILRQKGIDLFESKSLFYTFLSTFPIKTPSGRYLSPAGIEGVIATKLKKKWDSTFKNKTNLEEKAIKVLEAEVEWRKKSGNMEFIHNAETWLNQGDYEKYEYLLEDKQNNKYNDWM